jgi:dihydroorotase-like cyclic amidohydrolase
MTPPLRDHKCQHALWRGLKFDDLQLVATDHCPFCFNENRLGLLKSKRFGQENFNQIPNGAPGVELRLTLLYDGGRQSRTHQSEPVCAAHRHRPSQDVWLVSAKGDDRDRQRC